MNDPVWLQHARKDLGLAEIPGPKHNSRIVAFWESVKIHFRDDETPWCGAFVGAKLAQAGYPINPRGASARSWANYGTPIDRPCVGAIVVFWRGSRNGSSGHVGFVVGVDQNGNLMVLGGNQGNRVSIAPFSRDRVLAYRWPGHTPDPSRYMLPVLNSDGKLSQNEA